MSDSLRALVSVSCRAGPIRRKMRSNSVITTNTASAAAHASMAWVASAACSAPASLKIGRSTAGTPSSSPSVRLLGRKLYQVPSATPTKGAVANSRGAQSSTAFATGCRSRLWSAEARCAISRLACHSTIASRPSDTAASTHCHCRVDG